MRYRGIHYHVLTRFRVVFFHVLTRFQDHNSHVLTIYTSYKGTKINKNTKVWHFFLYKINWNSMACKGTYAKNGFSYSHMLPH